jgi:hypothetical protein
MKLGSGIPILAGHALRGIAAAAAFVCAGQALAGEIEVSNPDLKVRLDTTTPPGSVPKSPTAGC